MPVERVPSFWDHLSQGYIRGESNAKEEQARQDRLKQQALQNQMALFQHAAQYGSVADMQKAAGGIPGMEGMSFAERPEQLRSRILAAPPGQGASEQLIQTGGGFGSQLILPNIKGQDKFTDDQRRTAGLPTALQKRQETVTGQELDLKEKTTKDAIQNFDRDKQMERMTKLEPVLKDAATRFIAGPINKMGGQLKREQLPQLAEMAFQNFIADSQGKPYGNMTPEDAQQAKAYFDQAVNEAYNAQLKREIDRLRALPASAFGSGDFNPSTMVNALNNLTRTKQNELDDMLNRNPLLKNLQMIPPARWTPEQAKMMEPIQRLRTDVSTLGQAAAGFAGGSVTVERAQELLNTFAGSVGSGVPKGEGMAPHAAAAGDATAGRPALSATDKQNAKTNKRFADWLKQRGYSEADWK